MGDAESFLIKSLYWARKESMSGRQASMMFILRKPKIHRTKSEYKVWGTWGTGITPKGWGCRGLHLKRFPPWADCYNFRPTPPQKGSCLFKTKKDEPLPRDQRKLSSNVQRLSLEAFRRAKACETNCSSTGQEIIPTGEHTNHKYLGPRCGCEGN